MLVSHSYVQYKYKKLKLYLDDILLKHFYVKKVISIESITNEIDYVNNLSIF